MLWQVTTALNLLIAVCYVGIASVVTLGLVRTKQLTTNPLAVATAVIFLSCAAHHSHHAIHLMTGFGAHGQHDLAAVRAVFGEWHSVAIDAFGAVVAITYLSLRRNYKALLNTPAMFDDAVRVAAEQHLRQVAFTDQLTGIPNRAAYQQLADSLSGTDRQVHVLFIDLDGFKAINDTYGHDAGDRMLHDLAQRLAAGLADVGRLFRIGGDEFVLVALPSESTRSQVVAQAQALISMPVAVRDGEVVVSASIGVASGSALGGVDPLLRDADAHMYRIKAGRSGPVPPQRTPTDDPSAVSAA
jgi:diguanylate cyclase (GGDEF)-like protein